MDNNEKAPAIESLDFEKALEELEKIANSLDRGDVPLKESIMIYERGTQLKNHCKKLLQEAEEKVEKIRKTNDGKIEFADLDN